MSLTKDEERDAMEHAAERRRGSPHLLNIASERRALTASDAREIKDKLDEVIGEVAVEAHRTECERAAMAALAAGDIKTAVLQMKARELGPLERAVHDRETYHACYEDPYSQMIGEYEWRLWLEEFSL
jgi:hypothetical protein